MNQLAILAATVAVVIVTALVAVFLFSRFFAKQRVQLVDDWKNVWRFTSTWAIVAGSFLEAAVQVAPDEMLHLWSIMPDDMKALIPQPVARCIPIALVLLALPLRIIRQARLAQQPEKADAADHA